MSSGYSRILLGSENRISKRFQRVQCAPHDNERTEPPAAALARVEIGLADKNTRPPKLRVRAIDSHQHFWEYSPAEYPWIQPDWPIRKSFLPPDLEPLLRKCSFDGC